MRWARLPGKLTGWGGTPENSFKEAVDYFFGTPSREKRVALQAREDLINNLAKEITDYIVKLSEKPLSRDQSDYATVLLQTVSDLERIGDHAENIVELADYAAEHGVVFSENALEDLRSMVQLTEETLRLALKSLEVGDGAMAERVLKNEVLVDEMEKEYRKRHIQRLNEKLCTPSGGAVFLDMLNNLERISDHAVNIAEYVIGEAGVNQQKSKYVTAETNSDGLGE